MTINPVASNTAAAQAAQQPAAKHKPSVDFSKLMINAGDIKPNAAVQQTNGSAATSAENSGGINTTA